MGNDAVKYRRWTASEDKQLRKLAAPQTLFLKEIAQEMGLDVTRVRYRAKQLGVVSRPKARFGQWNAKYSHLREAVLTYFLKHTWEETRDHFGLKDKEIKSLFTVAYRMPEYKHLRKDTRRRDAWSQKEYLFLLRHAGLRDRDWIAGKLKRGGRHSIKDCVSDRLHGIWTKHMHGIPRKVVSERWGLEGLEPIQTKAGPINDTHSYQYLIIPWVTLSDNQKKLPSEIRPGIHSMARFQKWVYGTTTTRQTINRIHKAIAGKL